MTSLFAGPSKMKGQIKVQETAFMLLALVMLFALLFMFYMNFQMKQLYSEANKLKEEQAISMLQKLSAMPEFASTAEQGGIDYDKLLALRNVSGYDALWSGIRAIEVVSIFPQNESRAITVYKSKAYGSTLSYSTYIPLCVTRYTNGYIWHDCKLARLVVSIEEARQGSR